MKLTLLLLGTLLFCSALGVVPGCLAQTSMPSAVKVRLVTDEAEAVLAIIAKKKANQSITEADWQRVIGSEGYVRLKARETSMKRSFEDADFKAFVFSDDLAERSQALAETLARWKKADVTGAARLALAYLPKAALIKAKIYPVIKPLENSFVFDVRNDPAIFLYIDPKVGREKFENTLAHELHHIGYSSSCPSKRTSDEIGKLPPNAQRVLGWIGAFGEGFAMLAAAGGPDIHPHAVSSTEERARWDKDLANFNDDLKKVEEFFMNVLENRLTKDQMQATAFSFFGVQGPWYTVGWRMSVLIEKTFGRAKLIECICDQRKLLLTYNKAAVKYNRRSREPLVLWSPAVINGIAISNGTSVLPVSSTAATNPRHGNFESTTVKVGKVTRIYRLVVPKTVDLANPAPLVVAFHGMLIDSKDLMPLYTKLNETAEKHRFIIAYPNALGRSWGILPEKVKNDLAFFDALVTQLSANYKIDSNRIYVIGMSNGGYFAHLIGKERSGTVAAVASHSGPLGLQTLGGIKAKRKFPVLIIHGTRDRILPVGWASENRDKYRNEGHEVTYIELNGQGHMWATKANINETIWEFFFDHPKL